MISISLLIFLMLLQYGQSSLHLMHSSHLALALSGQTLEA